MNASTPNPALWSRLSGAIGQFLRRANPADANAALEDYLSSAQSLHQLEDMQRQWDRAHRGLRHHGAH